MDIEDIEAGQIGTINLSKSYTNAFLQALSLSEEIDPGLPRDWFKLSDEGIPLQVCQDLRRLHSLQTPQKQGCTLFEKSMSAFFRKHNRRKSKEFWRIYRLLVSSIPTLTTSSSTAHTDLQKAEFLLFIMLQQIAQSSFRWVGATITTLLWGDIEFAVVHWGCCFWSTIAYHDTSKSFGPDNNYNIIIIGIYAEGHSC